MRLKKVFFPSFSAYAGNPESPKKHWIHRSRLRPFGKPFDKLMVLSEVEGLMALSNIEGFRAMDEQATLRQAQGERKFKKALSC